MRLLSEGGNIATVGTDSETRSMHVALYVYNTDTLSWQKMTQPMEDVDFDGLVQANNEIYYKDNRYDYDASGNVTYVGRHRTLDADTSDDSWMVQKMTYTGSNATRIQTTECSWDDRETSF